MLILTPNHSLLEKLFILLGAVGTEIHDVAGDLRLRSLFEDWWFCVLQGVGLLVDYHNV